MSPRVIKDNTTLADQYESLSAGDIFVGRVRMRPGEEHVLLDLLARQVILVPSAVSQLCCRSKVFQARILGRYMVPGTAVVYDRHDILALVNDFGQRAVGKVVCKLDRANAGQGILLFNSVEEVYTCGVLETLRFPFVVQPFVQDGRDVRVVMLGERVDAYARHNSDNFRHNLHCGGGSSPYEPAADQMQLCREAMSRGGFPYAHIDLLLDPDGNTWLSEINLRGGMRGSTMSQQDYLEAVEQVHGDIVAGLLAGAGENRGQ